MQTDINVCLRQHRIGTFQTAPFNACTLAAIHRGAASSQVPAQEALLQIFTVLVSVSVYQNIVPDRLLSTPQIWLRTVLCQHFCNNLSREVVKQS